MRLIFDRSLLRTAAIAAVLLAGAPQLEAGVKEGVAHFEQRQYPAAVEELKKAVGDGTADAHAYCYLGRAQTELKSFDDAIRSLEKAVELSPQSSEFHQRLGEVYGLKARDANFLSQASLAGRIREHLEKAVELDANNLDARESLSEFYLEAPSMLGGSVEKAMAQAAAIEQVDGARGVLQYGGLYETQKAFDQAEEAYTRGILQHPESTALRLRLGYLHQNQKKWDKAFATFEALAKVSDRGRLLAYYQIGRTALLSQRNLPRGIECLSDYVATAPAGDQDLPPLPWAYTRLAQVYKANKQPDQARQALDKALKLDPQFEEAKKVLKDLG